MRTITPRYSVTLTSVETSVQALIADRFGLAVGVAGIVTLAGALMFVPPPPKQKRRRRLRTDHRRHARIRPHPGPATEPHTVARTRAQGG